MADIIKKDTDYAMRLLVYLARKPRETPVSARELARTQQVPLEFTYKILQKLARAGLVQGRMGAHGGFRLAAGSQEITLLRVASAIQGPLVLRKCCLDIEACPRRPTCETSEKLGQLQDILTGSLESITLKDIIKHRAS